MVYRTSGYHELTVLFIRALRQRMQRCMSDASLCMGSVPSPSRCCLEEVSSRLKARRICCFCPVLVSVCVHVCGVCVCVCVVCACVCVCGVYVVCTCVCACVWCVSVCVCGV